jgi:hypothetical protein
MVMMMAMENPRKMTKMVIPRHYETATDGAHMKSIYHVIYCNGNGRRL